MIRKVVNLMKKKVLALILSCVLCLSFGISVGAAASYPDADVSDDAYIIFSERLAANGISAQTCLEDFVSGYESFDGGTVEQYVDSLVVYEMTLVPQLDAAVSRNLEIAAEYFATHADEAVSVQSGGGGGSIRGEWYDNIGETNPKLPQEALYDTYDILSTVKKGDIIHETSGGIASLVGHIAIVEGKYWDSTYKQWYIRTVEATLPTVTHGVLDDARYDHRGVDVYYVTNASSTEKTDAVDFCLDQIGKPWSLEVPLLSSVSYDSNNKNWYCSELVWAGYYNAGVNLHGSSIPKHIYTPAKLASSSKLTSRNVEG